VPAKVLEAALVDPSGVRGYGQREYPGKPASPFNRLRANLDLQDSGRPWNLLYNGLVFRVGCR